MPNRPSDAELAKLLREAAGMIDHLKPRNVRDSYAERVFAENSLRAAADALGAAPQNAEWTCHVCRSVQVDGEKYCANEDCPSHKEAAPQPARLTPEQWREAVERARRDLAANWDKEHAKYAHLSDEVDEALRAAFPTLYPED